MIKEVSTGYKPRTHQAYIHMNVRRFNVFVCHRRFGKTHLALNEIIDRGLTNFRKDPQYAYIAPTYGQAKRVAWDLLKDYVKHIPGVVVNESELRVDVPRPSHGDRVRFMLLGAENPGGIRGMYLDGVVFDEYAEMVPEVWVEVVRPALSDRLGWAIFIGTPKGNNHFYETYINAQGKDDWFTAIFKASETQIIPESELAAAREIMSEEAYAQEYECSFTAALVGSYYGKEMAKAEEQGRITNVPYDPLLPVYTYWDLGVNDTTVIWFMQVLRGQEIRVIDYIEDSGVGLPDYAKRLKDLPYVYEEIMLPHDGAVKELGTGKSRQETLQNLMRGVPVRIAPRQSVADGINASRLLLAKCWFDESKCSRGIECLKHYEREWDSKNKIFRSTPKHNWASHGADAFRTAAMTLNENRASKEEKAKFPRRSNGSFSVV